MIAITSLGSLLNVENWLGAHRDAGLHCHWLGEGARLLALASASDRSALSDAAEPLHRLVEDSGLPGIAVAGISLIFTVPFDLRPADIVRARNKVFAAHLAAARGALSFIEANDTRIITPDGKRAGSALIYAMTPNPAEGAVDLLVLGWAADARGTWGLLDPFALLANLDAARTVYACELEAQLAQLRIALNWRAPTRAVIAPMFWPEIAARWLWRKALGLRNCICLTRADGTIRMKRQP